MPRARDARRAPGTLALPALWHSVVVLLAVLRHRRHVVHFFTARRALRRLRSLGRLIAALVRSADPLGGREPSRMNSTRGRSQRRGLVIADARRTACFRAGRGLVTRVTATPSTTACPPSAGCRRRRTSRRSRAVSRPSRLAQEDVGDCRPDQLARDHVGAAQLALVFQLELAGDRRQRRVDVGEPRHRRRARRSPAPAAPAFDSRRSRSPVMRQALADAGALVDAPIRARLERHSSITSRTADRHVERRRAVRPVEPRFLRGDRHRRAAALAA